MDELEALRAKVADQERTIERQAKEIAQLRELVNVEKRYLTDTGQHGFKAFLKQRPKTPLIEKLLADQFFLPRDTRAHYEYRLARLQCSEQERAEFEKLWKLMLLSS